MGYGKPEMDGYSGWSMILHFIEVSNYFLVSFAGDIFATSFGERVILHCLLKFVFVDVTSRTHDK